MYQAGEPLERGSMERLIASAWRDESDIQGPDRKLHASRSLDAADHRSAAAS